jgi:hypothetical protein
VFDEGLDAVLKEICLDIERRYQLKFLEIGTTKDQSNKKGRAFYGPALFVSKGIVKKQSGIRYRKSG